MTFFDADYIETVDAEIRGESVDLECQFIETHVLSQYSSPAILDVCCGHGRHLGRLARPGRRLVGVDLSGAAIEVARHRHGDRCELIHSDFLDFHRPAAFDVVLHLETSLGTFPRALISSVVRRAAECLSPGGRLVIHTAHGERARQALSPKNWFEYPSGLLVLEERRFSADGRELLLEQRRLRPSADGRLTISIQRIELCLLTPEEVAAAIEDAGLTVERAYGDFCGGAFTAESPDILIIGHKSDVDPLEGAGRVAS